MNKKQTSNGWERKMSFNVTGEPIKRAVDIKELRTLPCGYWGWDNSDQFDLGKNVLLSDVDQSKRDLIAFKLLNSAMNVAFKFLGESCYWNNVGLSEQPYTNFNKFKGYIKLISGEESIKIIQNEYKKQCEENDVWDGITILS
tara:strand:- start:777 stop:1205 length:429 start_codon:yes stop_codon:yes gene_type:complete